MSDSLKKSILFRRELKWSVTRPGTRRKIPSKTSSWIYESKSLTARLRRNCTPCIQVRVLTQAWQKPFVGESKLLKQAPYRHALVREVQLECNGIPLIAARTIIPAKTLTGVRRRLSRLGTRPLGEFIFCYPRLKRLALQVAQPEPGDWSSAAEINLALQRKVWGRRTLYSIGGPKLIICEFFLPTVLEFNDA